MKYTSLLSALLLNGNRDQLVLQNDRAAQFVHQFWNNECSKTSTRWSTPIILKVASDDYTLSKATKGNPCMPRVPTPSRCGRHPHLPPLYTTSLNRIKKISWLTKLAMASLSNIIGRGLTMKTA